MPSETNICTRWPRCIPMARAIPISLRLSAANITKIRKIRSTPANMEKMPKMVKTVVNTVPPIPAAATTVFLLSTSSTSRSLIRPRISTNLLRGLTGEGQSPQPILHVRLGQDHPQLLGDAGTRQFRDQKGRALGQGHVCPPAEEGQEVGHVLSRWTHGGRGGAVRAGLDGSQHVRLPQQCHQLRQASSFSASARSCRAAAAVFAMPV